MYPHIKNIRRHIKRHLRYETYYRDLSSKYLEESFNLKGIHGDKTVQYLQTLARDSELQAEDQADRVLMLLARMASMRGK